MGFTSTFAIYYLFDLQYFAIAKLQCLKGMKKRELIGALFPDYPFYAQSKGIIPDQVYQGTRS